ncbi:hypothetical protein ACHAQA_009844 [Verticillium albo-atrum]
MRLLTTRALQARPTIAAVARPVFSLRLASTIPTSSTTVETSIPATESATASTITRNVPETPKSSTRAYLIDLTPSKNYPVYPRTKSAGQSKFTVIKRIEGDKRAFAQDLAEATGLPREDITISPVTNHVQIKGLHVTEVKKWLTDAFGDPHKPKVVIDAAAP